VRVHHQHAVCASDGAWQVQTQEADSQITQRGHRSRRTAGADAAAVFVTGHVADAVQALDRPMAPHQAEYASLAGTIGRQAGTAPPADAK